MPFILYKHNHDLEYKLCVSSASSILCIENNMLEHEFTGVVEDVETAVDLNNKKRIAGLDEEDDMDRCLADMVQFHRQLSVSCVIHNTTHIIFTLSTPWIYNDPEHDIVSQRRHFYVLFETTSRIINRPKVLTALIDNMDKLPGHQEI